MNGLPFLEPTIELANIGGIKNGNFSVNHVPTENPEKKRWYVFIADLTNHKLEVYSIDHTNASPFDYSSGSDNFTISPQIQGPSGVTTLQISNGPGSCLYYQQEKAQVREVGMALWKVTLVSLFAIPVENLGLGLERGILVYDFGVLLDGGLPKIDGSAGAALSDGIWSNGKYSPSVQEKYPLPVSGMQLIDGLVVSSSVLGQIHSASSPSLFAGGDGLIHCYYTGVETQGLGEFLVAQFDTYVSRNVVNVPWTTSPPGNTPGGTITGGIARVCKVNPWRYHGRMQSHRSYS